MRKKNLILVMAMVAALLPTLFTGCSKQARVARHERRADEYFAAGDLSKAEVEYLNTLRAKSDDPHAFVRLGTLYYQQGRFGRAFAYLTRASQLASNDWDVHVKLASIYISGQQTKEAQQHAILVLDNSPTNAEAPVLLAESVASTNDLTMARARISKLSKQVGETADVQIALGILAMKSGDMKAAETAIKRATVLDPKSSAAYFALGTLYMAENSLKEADAAFKTASDLAPVRSSRRLSYAIFKIRNGELAEGKRLLAEISKEAPDYIPAWIQQAEIALSEKKFDDCSSLLDQALGRDIDNYQALLVRARLRLAQTDGEKAKAELEHAAVVYNGSPQIQYYLALAYVLNKDPVGEMASLNKALSLNPEFPDAILMLAELNIRQGNLNAAVTLLTQFVNRHPQVPQGYVLLGNAYLAQKDPDRALAVFKRMAEIFSKTPQVQFMVGMIQKQQNKVADARKSFELALSLDPLFISATEALVDLDMGEKHFSVAQDRAQKEIDKQPKAAEPLLLLAKVYMARAGDLVEQANKTNPSASLANTPAALAEMKQAEAILLKASNLNPDLSTSYLMLAELYMSTGKEQAALDRLNQLVAKTNTPIAYMQIGMIHDSMKQYPEARDAYEKVLAAKPDSSPALNNLAYLYSAHLVDLDRAYNYALKAHDLTPDDPSAGDTFGWILYKRGDYVRALAVLEPSAAKLQDQPEVMFHVGMARYMMGDEDGARTALGRAAASSADFPGKADIAGCLAVLAVDPKTADAKALADLKKRSEDQPKDPIAVLRIAAIYERDGDLTNAAKAYEKALTQNSNAQIMGRLALIYANLKDTQKALDMAKKAHNLAPDNASISLTLGRLVFQSGDYNWALSLLQDASRRLSSQVDILYDVAWANYAVGRVSEAETAMRNAQPALSGPKLEDAKRFQTLVAAAKSPATVQAATAQAGQILNSEPNYVPAIMVMAIQQQQQAKLDDATKSYEKAISIYSGFLPAIRNLAILYANRGTNDQRAFDLATQARSALPNDPEVARALGVVTYRRGDYPRSVTLLKESALKITNDPELYYYLGMAQYQLKQKPESKDALQHALNLNLQAKLADDARKTLLQLK